MRCGWVGADPEYERYHDEEWGYPLHGDRELFEKLSLEAFQSGLSSLTILIRRDAFRAAFADFSPDIVARFTDDHVGQLLNNSGIIRNRAKILAAIATGETGGAAIPHPTVSRAQRCATTVGLSVRRADDQLCAYAVRRTHRRSLEWLLARRSKPLGDKEIKLIIFDPRLEANALSASPLDEGVR